MKEEISEYYKKKGYIAVYVATNKEPRRVATLRKANGEMTSMAYAKYKYTSHYCCDVCKGDQVDHINGNRMDDRLENLQVVSALYNTRKSKKTKEMIECKCPICGQYFLFPKKNLKTHPNPSCSRKCGYKKLTKQCNRRS